MIWFLYTTLWLGGIIKLWNRHHIYDQITVPHIYKSTVSSFVVVCSVDRSWRGQTNNIQVSSQTLRNNRVQSDWSQMPADHLNNSHKAQLAMLNSICSISCGNQGASYLLILRALKKKRKSFSILEEKVTVAGGHCFIFNEPDDCILWNDILWQLQESKQLQGCLIEFHLHARYNSVRTAVVVSNMVRMSVKQISSNSNQDRAKSKINRHVCIVCQNCSW